MQGLDEINPDLVRAKSDDSDVSSLASRSHHDSNVSNRYGRRRPILMRCYNDRHLSMMAQTVIRAEVDRNARLMRSDSQLLGLQARAGGQSDGPLVIPQLVRLAKLAMRMETPISRPVLAGDDDCDVSMWVRVVPHLQGATLEMVDWQETERAARMPGAAEPSERTPLTMHSIIAEKSRWEWSCDAQLRLTGLVRKDQPVDLDKWIGRSVSEFFRLLPNPQGFFPLLQALARQEGFDGQPVEIFETKEKVELWATALTDSAGRFFGYQGIAGNGSAAQFDASEGELILTEIVEETQGSDIISPIVSDERSDENHSDLLGFGSQVGDFSRRIDGALRRPLGRIIANAETISGKLEGPIRQDYANYAKDIAEAGRHLMGLIDDLADLQAIERPDFQPAKEDVDLADIGRRTAGLLAMKARDRSIRIDAPDLDECVMAEGEFRRILQILINLVGNAIRYSPEGSMIWIRAESEGGHAVVTIADQGKGLSSEDQEKVFEKFERLGRDDSGGSGLGLYIARRLARAMHGDIVIDSAPGQGARFSLILPAKKLN